MGNLAAQCFDALSKDTICDIKKKEDENDLNNEKVSNSNKIKTKKKNNSLNIADIIDKSNTITTNKKTKINDDSNVDIAKIIKIQNTYHNRYLQNKFQTEIKPSIEKKTKEYMNNIYKKLSIKENFSGNIEDFSENNWQNYYPLDDKFFLGEKGEVYKDQIRIKNEKDLNNIEIYEGEMNHQNMKHGNGILTTPQYILKGTWRNDEFTGWGIKCMRNGEIYEGKFINGNLNGKGIYKNGDNIYEGDFINNERNGKGKLITEKYNYIGEFKNNKLDGQGEIEFFEDGQKYEGTFEDNEINGKGIYKWKWGDVYEGQMKNGKMNGKGKYTYSDGKIYEGEYNNNIKEGKGKITFPDGRYYEGNFINGELDGEILCFEDNKKSKRLFVNGQFKKYL
jgi:hypothetical protein